MDRDGNPARMIRAMVENLHELAESYDETGQLNCRDQINDAADAIGALIALPDADEDGDDTEGLDER